MTRFTCAFAAAALGLAAPLAAQAAANPASVFCGGMGGQSVTATLASGDEIGLCVLPGDKIVEEWTLLRMFDGKVPAAASNPFRS